MKTKQAFWMAVFLTVALAGSAFGQFRFPARFGQAKLIGTWYVTVPDSPDAAGFNAYQTFNLDGTLTETSSLLGTLTEGPARGVWSGNRLDYVTTFELFAFDENGDASGRVRVRSRIHLIDDDHFEGSSVVDFILPDGTVLEAVGSGDYSGERMQVIDPDGMVLPAGVQPDGSEAQDCHDCGSR